MAQVPVERSAAFGLGLETTCGTRAAPTFGMENINKGTIKPGQTFADDRKFFGFPWMRQIDKKVDRLGPTLETEFSMSVPNIGLLLALLTQQAQQSGSGPFIQTVLFPIIGINVTVGDAGSVNGRTATVVTKYGQTGNRDVAGLGGVISEISMTFGEGRVKPKAKFMFMGYSDSDDGTGVYTLPSAPDVSGRDAIFKFGDGTPVALFSDEVTLTLRAVVNFHWYGGVQAGGRPHRLVFSDWTGEVSFTKPLIQGTDSLMKDYFVNGGEVANDALMYIYDRSLAAHDTALSANGQWRFKLNVSLDDVETQLADETKDVVTASLRYDGANFPVQYEQCTTATQASWAT